MATLTVKNQPEYVLSLSEAEASALRSLLGNLPGAFTPEEGPLYAIWLTLDRANTPADTNMVELTDSYRSK